VLLGAHRALDPEETLKTVEPKAKAIGVTKVSEITGLDRVGIPDILMRKA